MSEVGKVEYKIRGDNSSFENDIGESKNIASRAASAIGGAFVTAMAAASAAVIAGATAGVKYNAQMEQYATSFEVMLGSSEAALAKIAELKEFAAKTPFEMTDLADATKVMLGFGLSEDKASKMLKVLGDISQGDSTKLSSLTLAFSQMSSTGRLMGQDLLQMINAGFNPLQSIAEKTGETMAEVKERMEKGGVSADEVTEAFISATEAGGLFYQSMDKQSKTFNGQLSTLKDNAMSFLGELTEGLTAVATNDVLPFLSEELGKLQTAFSENGFAGVADAFGEVLGDITKRVLDAVPDIASAASDIVNGLLEGIAENTDSIASGASELMGIFAQGLVDAIPILIDISVSLIEGIVQGIADNASILVEGSYSIMTAIMDGITTLLPAMIPAIIQIILAVAQGITDNAALLIDGAYSIVTALINGITALLPTLIPVVIQIIMAIVSALISPDNLVTLIEAAINLILTLAEGLIDAIPQLLEVVPQIISSLVDMLLSPEFLGMLIEAGIRIIFALIEGIINTISGVISAGQKLMQSLNKVFTDSIKSWIETGKNIVSGIWEGIESSWNSLVKNITDKVGGLIKSVKKMFGINSPSTVFKSIFVNVVKGSEVGWDDEFPNLERKINTNYGGLLDGLSAESAVTPAAAINGAGVSPIQIEVPLQLDGREVARATAFYTSEQISWLGA